jgi:hypothetical protein
MNMGGYNQFPLITPDNETSLSRVTPPVPPCPSTIAAPVRGTAPLPARSDPRQDAQTSSAGADDSADALAYSLRDATLPSQVPRAAAATPHDESFGLARRFFRPGQ